MTDPRIDETIAVARHGARTVYHRRDVALDAVLEALDAPGETLKVSAKSVTRRVGPWVVKASRAQGGLGVLKRTLQRGRYRRAWTASHFLAHRGICVPQPHAFVEEGRFGVIVGNALITEYLDGCQTVERHAAGLAASSDEVAQFLGRLADAVNALTATGAYHTDLSGKNIFTDDGETFYFIDLDGIVLDFVPTDGQRMKTHVQLYDSFCDLWAADVLDPFISRMCPGASDRSAWLHAVHEGQRTRRAKHAQRMEDT